MHIGVFFFFQVFIREHVGRATDAKGVLTIPEDLYRFQLIGLVGKSRSSRGGHDGGDGTAKQATL